MKKGNKCKAMNILIIGNGYDLSMGLKTSYPDFLDMLEMAKINTLTWPNGEALKLGYKRFPLDYEKESTYLDFCNSVGQVYAEEFRKIAEESFWAQHFIETRLDIGDKWLNLEEEIKRVIDIVVANQNASRGRIRGPIEIKTLNRWASNRGLNLEKEGFKKCFEVLKRDLDVMIRALEIYMDAYINKQETSLPNDLDNKKFDKLLSFNYTSTYANATDISHFSNPSKDFCYVHGKADIDGNHIERRMVLGFDDHYKTDAKTVLEKVPFEKYYQRIVNRTDNNYMDWLKDIDAGEPSTVTIYGHSLAPSDGDILKQFIDNKNVKTDIYYLDEEDRAMKVQNLAVILEPQRLIELSGPTPQVDWKEITKRS